MLLRTHLIIGLAAALYFLPYIHNKIVFFPVVLLASLMPDIDTAFSSVGKHKLFRPLQWIVTHRGFIHSYTICLIISLLFAFYYPVLAFPFFVGYSFHLFMDAFTVQGIRAFWPLKFRYGGRIKTGGSIDKTIFVVMLIVDCALIVRLFI